MKSHLESQNICGAVFKFERFLRCFAAAPDALGEMLSSCTASQWFSPAMCRWYMSPLVSSWGCLIAYLNRMVSG